MDNDSSSHDQDIIEILRGLESRKEEYPAELLAARRELFLKSLEQHTQLQPAGKPERDPKLLAIFRRWTALEPRYPLQLLARRRTLYKQQLAETARVSIWYVLRSSLSNIFASWSTFPRSTSMKLGRASVLALGIAMFAFVAFALYGNATQVSNLPLAQNEIFTPTSASVTSVAQGVLVCKNGYEPPLCLAREFAKSPDLSYAGNGKARPAVAKDSFASDGQVHHAAHLNDGLYGPAASWVSNSPNSWIKIDLGITTDVNTVVFGRDRLSNLNGGDPGRFIIAVATSDDVYANGDSGNDEIEYAAVYDSQQVGFDGKISGGETIVVLFEMKQARFIKITFANAHTAIDEVEAFVSDPTVIAMEPTRALPREDSQPDASTSLPVYTPLPTDTLTAVPIDTLPPTETVTPIPTDPPTPVETPTPIDTPIPTHVTDPPPAYTPIFDPTEEPTPTDEPIGPVPDESMNPLPEVPALR